MEGEAAYVIDSLPFYIRFAFPNKFSHLLLQQNSTKEDSSGEKEPSPPRILPTDSAESGKVRKMLKRSNTSPMLPSRATGDQTSLDHNHSALHRKLDVHSMVVSSSKAFDPNDSLEPTLLQMSSAIDVLAPPTHMESAESLLAPPSASQTELNTDEKLHEFLPNKDLPAIAQETPQAHNTDGIPIHEPLDENNVTAIHTISALDLLAPPGETSD